MVWVQVKEKHRGVMNPKPFWKKYKSAYEARNEARAWNSLGKNDHIYIKKIVNERPNGLKQKPRVKGIYVQTSAYKERRKKRR